MSVAVCRSSFSPFECILVPNIAREPLPISPTNWQPPAEQYKPTEPPVEAEKDDDRPGQFDIWSSIQSQKAKEAATADPPAPYVYPLVRRSSRLMSQKSLQICTESLGSETGSADFSALLDDFDCFASGIEEEEEERNQPPIHETPIADEEGGPHFTVAKAVEERRVQSGRKELVSVNYHCSINRRSPPRSFPPPLPSISRRDGPCIHMKPHRSDGRLVLKAVPVPSQNYLHAQRQDGRLLLSFIDNTFNDPDDVEVDIPEVTQQEKDVMESKAKEEEEEEEATAMAQEEEGELEEEKNRDEEEEEEEEEDEEVEEEVEVVDRGTVVEVKVSTQPQQQSGSMKMQRSSSFVINKFVGAGETRWAEKTAECKPTTAPDKQQIQHDHYNPSTATPAPARRAAPTTTTAAAAAAAASTFSTSSEGYYSNHYYSFHGRGPLVGGGQYASPDDHKLLFTSKRRNREELLHHMRCSQLRRPLFILEPCCIATSS